MDLTRRQLLAAGAVAAAGAALPAGAQAAEPVLLRTTFGDGDGWPAPWRTVGVATLRQAAGEGLLVAGSDVFPDDPRPVAFAVDRRFADGEVSARIAHGGREAGVVLRRVAHRTYYAATHDTQAGELRIVRRTPDELTTLTAVPAPVPRDPLSLSLRAEGRSPTRLVATLTDALGRAITATATDATAALQAPGDPGVLATSQTFITDAEQAVAAFGNARLALFGLQEGEAAQPLTGGYQALVEERSTARFTEIVVRSGEAAGPTRPSVVAATTGVPARGGARLGIATDVPAEIVLEVSDRPSMRRARRISAGRTGAFDAAFAALDGGRPGRRVHWRARVRRGGSESVGPVRSFRVLPRPGAPGSLTLAIASCGSRFGPAFDAIAERSPDALVWQGDLNYPDAHGPLAQTTSAYAGIWRDFLAGPRMAPILGRAAFACQRDDHDYGLQDTNGADRKPPAWGLAPWEALMNDRTYYRFGAGPVEVWVLDQRQFKSAAALPDTPAKSLLGAEQRAWLLRTLAASRAPFKIVCSPCTLHYGDNARDGNWGSGFTAERDLLLKHVAGQVSGRTVFVTGDSHDTMAYERDGVVELRACPVSIPEPRDHPGIYGPGGRPGEGFASEGIRFADTASHFCLVEARSTRRRSVLDLTLVREDGTESFTRRFQA